MSKLAENIHYCCGFAFFVSTAQQMMKLFEVRNGSTETSNRGIYYANMCVNMIAGSSAWLTAYYRWGGTCTNVFGVETVTSQWAEWLTSVPLIVYMAVAIKVSGGREGGTREGGRESDRESERRPRMRVREDERQSQVRNRVARVHPFLTSSTWMVWSAALAAWPAAAALSPRASSVSVPFSRSAAARASSPSAPIRLSPRPREMSPRLDRRAAAKRLAPSLPIPLPKRFKDRRWCWSARAAASRAAPSGPIRFSWSSS